MKAKWVTVRVTAAMIKSGKRRDVWRCPIALALKHALHKPVAATFTYWRVRTRAERDIKHLMPSLVANWISSFDSWSAVRPFSFRIKV